MLIKQAPLYFDYTFQQTLILTNGFVNGIWQHGVNHYYVFFILKVSTDFFKYFLFQDFGGCQMSVEPRRSG